MRAVQVSNNKEVFGIVCYYYGSLAWVITGYVGTIARIKI